MAKRSSASPAPQNGSGTANVTTTGRATRSGTREPQEASRAVPNRTRGASAQASGSVGGLSGPAAALAGLAALGRAGGLDAVDEESDNVILPLNDDDGPRLGAGSGYSAFTSLSQDELKNLDSDTILGNLSQLDKSAEEILNYVAPSNADASQEMEVWEIRTNDLLNESSRFRKSLIPRLKALHALQSGFGGHTFINNELVLRCLLDLPADRPVLSTPWRIDEILFKANLVTLLEKVFTTKDEGIIYDLTQTLDSQFPRFAMDTLVSDQAFRGLAGESKLVDGTLDIALEIRTQFFIHTLGQVTSGDPFETAFAAVFLAEEDEPGFDISDGTSAYHLRPFNSVISDVHQSTHHSKVNEHLNNLKSIAAQGNGNIETIIESLRAQFPWSNCCFSILEWSHYRHDEITQIIRQRGGVDHIIALLEEQVQEINSNMDPALMTGGVRLEHSTPRTLSSKSNIEALKQRRLRLSGKAASIVADETPFDDGLFVSSNSNFGDANDRELARHLAAFSQQDQQQRRFLDQQDGAHRVMFDGTQHSFGGTPMKRLRDEIVDFSPSQDQGFQTDTRHHPTPTRAPRAVMTSGRNIVPRTSYANDVSESSAQGRARQNPGTALERMPTPTMDENGNLDPTPSDMYQQVKQVAKQSNVFERTARKRTKFSPREEEQILALIAEFGPEYSKIKVADRDNRGDVLEQRTAEDIRFKARNIKMDYLKARVPLPPGFEAVNLGRKETDRLKLLGVPYQQSPQRTTNHNS